MQPNYQALAVRIANDLPTSPTSLNSQNASARGMHSGELFHRGVSAGLG
jgi:hypothetical protein